MLREDWQVRVAEALASGVEVKNSILLGGDGRTISSGGLEAPVLQGEQDLLIELGTETLKDGLGDDVAAFVDHDLDDNVAFGVGQLPRVSNRIRSRNRQCRPRVPS